MSRVLRNSKCPCGSQLRYKRCCGEIKENAFLREPPLSIHIESKGKDEAAIIVSDAEMTVGDITRTVLEEELVISTNKAKGDYFKKSSATVMIPFEEEFDGVIDLKGNASVTNRSSCHTLSIRGGRKK